MFKNTLFILLTVLTINNVFAQTSSCECTYTINSIHWEFDGADIGHLPNVTIHDPLAQAIVNQGDTLTTRAGDVICLDASIPYGPMTFKNILGDPVNPVIIRNIGGQVKIKSTSTPYGWAFKNFQYFKILGDGDPDHRYGFKVTTHYNSYIQMISKTTDFEIAFVEIAGDTVAHQAAVDVAISDGVPLVNDLLGFAGIMAKSQPLCRDSTPGGGSTDACNFELQNVSIHDNYIHDVSGEGMYVGYGQVDGTTVGYTPTGGGAQLPCPTENFPHHVSNLFIYNNIVERTGWDGIQVKNAHRNAQVYDNVIKDYGILENGNHDEGLFVGDGSEAVIYGNWVENGTIGSNGIQINAYGNTKIYNNVVLSPGTNGLYLNNQTHQVVNKDGTFEIYNNTIEEGSPYTAMNGQGVPVAVPAAGMKIITPQDVIIKNNIVFGGTSGIREQTTDIVDFNIEEPITASVGFVDYANGDIRLGIGATAAINSGENHKAYSKYDFTGVPRITSTDTIPDIGAFEYGSVINSADLSIAIITPVSNNVTAPRPSPGATVGRGVLIVGSLIDTKNKVRFVEYIVNNTTVIGRDYMPRDINHTVQDVDLSPGPNTFKIKVTLYGGQSFFSDPITINKRIYSVISPRGR